MRREGALWLHRGRPPCYCMLLLQWLCYCATVGSGKAVLPPGDRLSLSSGTQVAVKAWEPGSDKRADTVVVGLLDGSLVSVDMATGELLWKFKSGSPLVSSSTSGGVEEGRGSPLIFPGADGSLYTYQESGETSGVQKLPVTVPELVELSPSITVDNALVLGSKQTTVFMLDRRTGKLLKTFSSQDSATLLNAELDNEKIGLLEPGIDWDSTMFVGRDDYIVRSLKTRGLGKQLWNVTYSRLRCLDPGSLFTSPDIDVDADRLAHEGLLAAGSDGALYRMEQESQRETWAIKLGSHPVGAFLDGRGHNLLLRDTAAKIQGLAREATKRAWGGVSKGSGDGQIVHAENSRVMLGRMEDTVYVLPMETMVIMDVSPDKYAALPAGSDITGDISLEEGAEFSEDGSKVIDVGFGDGGIGALGGDLSCPYPMGLQTLIEAPCDNVPDFIPKLLPSNPPLPDPVENVLAPPLFIWPAPWALVIGFAGVLLPLFVLVVALRMSSSHQPLSHQDGRQGSAIPDVQQPTEAGGSAFSAPLAGEGERVTPNPTASTGKKKAKKGKGKGSHGSSSAAKSSARSTVSDDCTAPAEELPADAGFVIGGQDDGSHSHHSHMSGNSMSERSMLVRERFDEPGGVVCIGRMRVETTKTLGLGSAGTVVYEGELDGRRVAVKRLLSQFYDLARKELDTLVRSDDHPNIVRCFALEEDREFVYLALELCSSSLADLVERNQSAELVTFTGHPTELAMSIAQNVVAGLSTLHNRGIVHRDLKPANVLMTDGNVAKVSDMGLCKRLVEEQSSFESIGAGGSSGWQAPEQLKQRLPGAPPIGRQTKSIDVFSLGCVLYYCFTGGRHPFGDERFARDGNIITGSVNLSGLVFLPLHKHVVSCMLLQDPNKRPDMRAVQSHPVWWSPAKQLAFLVDLSDRVESEDREVLPSERALLTSLESMAKAAIGGTGNWQDAMDLLLLNNLGKFRKYSPHSLRDLLRVIRNKNNHFREMPTELQELLGPQPQGFLNYFACRFPSLLLSAWLWALHSCAGDPPLDKYFPEDCNYSWGYKPPKIAPASAAPVKPNRSEGTVSSQSGNSQSSMPARSSRHNPNGLADSCKLEMPLRLPQRPGETVCSFYERTGLCKFGEGCRFDHPPFARIGVSHPVRPSAPPCDFYMKTGGCLYGQGCKFHHPPERAVKRNSDGFPLRYGAEVCPDYEKFGQCGQGWFCKFHHPEPQLGNGAELDAGTST